MNALDLVRKALVSPHPASERFDPEYMIAMRCKRCGKTGMGPHSQLQQAAREHFETPACRALGDKAGPQEMRIFYPRS